MTYALAQRTMMVYFVALFLAYGSEVNQSRPMGNGACPDMAEKTTDNGQRIRSRDSRVIDSIPAPPGEMKMGLTEQGDYLWIFTNTTNSYSVFYKIRKSDGSIIKQFNFPDTATRYNVGLTMINNHLYTSEFYPVKGNIHVLDTLGSLIRTFNTGYDTRGLVWNGTNLWTTEADSMSILKMDTLGNVIAIYKNNGTIQWFMDITWDEENSTIWANDNAFALDINELSVNSSPFFLIQEFDHPCSQSDIPEGITYSREPDGGYLYTSAAYSPYIWKILVHDGGIEEKGNDKLQSFYATPVVFNRWLKVGCNIIDSQRVMISVLDITGRKLCKICDTHVNAGKHYFYWYGISDRNQELPAGVYFIEIKTGKNITVLKVVKIE